MRSLTRDRLKSLIETGHSKPVTRRDFLAQGFISFSAMSFVPTFQAFGKRMLDEGCGGGGAYIPFLVFDCAGGAALPANFLVTLQNGDLLKSYNQLGWDPHASDALDNSYGLTMAKNASKMLDGLNVAGSIEARARLRMGSFCHSAQSDNRDNPLNSAGLVARLGYKGTGISQAIGTQNSKSGGNSACALAADSFRALYVPSIDVLKDSLLFSASSALGSLSTSQLGRLFEKGKKLSQKELKHLENTQTGKLLTELVDCSYDENQKKLGGTFAVDARRDPIFQTVYQINENSAANSEQVVAAGIVKSVLSGLTGPGVITIGDCDYHNNTQEKGDAKDREIGVHIGRALQAAHVMKKSFFFQIITDGGCSNIAGTRIWTSDANEKCMTVIGYYRPEGAPAQRRTQVGYFTQGQGAAKEAVTGLGESPLKVASSVFANYVSLHVPANQLSSEVFKHVPTTLFNGATELDEVLFYGA